MGVKQAAVTPAAHTNPGDSMLVMSPVLAEATDDACIDLLSPAPADGLRVLWVTTHERPGERIAHWAHHHDDPPVASAVIDVAGDDRTEQEYPTLHGEPVPVTELPSPQNLTRLGVEIVDKLSRWNRAGDAQIVLCFHSLSTFLQYVEVQQAFKFLHALTTELDRTGAIAHFHMDPLAHDEQSINALLPLFRSVVELEDDEWIYRSR